MGGRLVNRIASSEEKRYLQKRLHLYKDLLLDEDKIQDVQNIAYGVYSPLTGFLKKEDFQNVLSEMRLTSGVVWSIPIILDIDKSDYLKIKRENEVLLRAKTGEPVALLRNLEVFECDKGDFAEMLFQTTDKNHPGVFEIYQMGNYLVGGDILLFNTIRNFYADLNFTPFQTRKIFEEKGWQTIAGFQTRNIPHRSHEFLHQQTLKMVDGLFIQPVVGKKKADDFKDELVIKAYELLIRKHYPKKRVLLGVLPLKMRYAGPREALLHAIIRKNYGCTHFIVGRDHAGIKNYYGLYDAQNIFDHFSEDEIGIKILKFSNVLYCKKCKSLVSDSICSHPNRLKVNISSSRLREMVKNKQKISPVLIRPLIYQLLINYPSPFREE